MGFGVGVRITLKWNLKKYERSVCGLGSFDSGYGPVMGSGNMLLNFWVLYRLGSSCS